jgi:polyisoprenoid-binding protein YceI
MRHPLAIVTLALGLAAPAVAQTRWEIDPAHTSVQFSIRHLMISNVRGEFTKVSGTVVGDDKDPTRSTVEATIDTACTCARRTSSTRRSIRP